MDYGAHRNDTPPTRQSRWSAVQAGQDTRDGRRASFRSCRDWDRLDPIDGDVLASFQEDGPGWQDRINAALRKATRLCA